jgi:DHA1 family tetracycline resistance protein-like MFS transporter
MSDVPPESNTAPSAADPGGRAAPHPKRAAHLAIFLTVLIDLIGFGILIPILQPFAQEQFGASDMQAMWLMGIYSLMQFVFSPILGRISDRVGRRPVIIASLIGSMLGYLIIAQAANPVLSMDGRLSLALLFAARVVTGVCGASFSTAQAYLADITAPEKRAGVMGMIGAAFGIGFVLGPIIGGLTSDTPLGPSLPFYIAAGMSFANALYCWKKLPETLPPEKRGEPGANLSIRATVRSLRHTPFPAVISSNFLMITAFSIMTATFVIWAGKRLEFSQREIGLLFGFLGMIAILIQGGLIRRIAKNGNEAKLALIGAVCMVVSLALLPLAAPVPALLLVMALTSTGNSLATPTLNTLASQCGTVQNQGETMGAMSGAGSLGRFLGPFIAGWVMHFWEAKYEYAFWLAAGIMAGAAVAVARIQRKRVRAVEG